MNKSDPELPRMDLPDLPDLGLPADVDLPAEASGLSIPIAAESLDLPLLSDLPEVASGGDAGLRPISGLDVIDEPDLQPLSDLIGMYWPDRELPDGGSPVTLSGQESDTFPVLPDFPTWENSAPSEIGIPSVFDTNLPESENYDLSRFESSDETDPLSLPLGQDEDSHDPHLDLLREIAEGVKGLKPQSSLPATLGPSGPTQLSSLFPRSRGR